jgi:hypothetical protein
LRGGHQAKAAQYREQEKFNFLGGPPPKEEFLDGSAAMVNWTMAKIMKHQEK